MRHYYEDDEPSRRYRGEGYYGGYDESPRRGEYYERGEPRRRPGSREDRGFLDRAGDEVRSWFGDEDAQRRRERDERATGWGEGGRPGEGWGERGDERSWARQWGYVEGRGRTGGGERGRGERPSGERGWGDRERGWSDRERGWWGDRERGSEREPGRGERGSEGERATTSAPWYGGSSGWDVSAGSGGAVAGRGGIGPERYWGERRHESGAWGEYLESAWGRGGRHAGRGPRGYQRSDERIRDEVCERLALHGDIDASDLDVEVRGGEITLSGRVQSRHEKRLAEDLAESVWGVREVHNQIRVGQPAATEGLQEPGTLGQTGGQDPQPRQPGQGRGSRAA